MFKLFKSKKEDKTLNSDNNVDFYSIKDTLKIPQHVGIIMDGNGRWAKKRNLPRSFGHKQGVETIREIVKECDKMGIKYLTLYAFSTENWSRAQDEINTLMKLLVEYLRNEFKELNENGVVINHIGDISKLPKICQDELISAYERTKNNTGVVMNLALNYGGRHEIVRAVNKIVKDIKSGKVSEEITEQMIANYLDTSGMPDPDIIVRPSGEYRLSNFLIWQSAYSEFWYSDICWPDFKREHLQKVVLDYQKRDRRFGGAK